MIVEAEVVRQHSISLSNIKYQCNLQEIEDIVAITSTLSSCVFDSALTPESDESDSVRAHGEENSEDVVNLIVDSEIQQFVPYIRSGCFADIGCRRYMEDEHIMIDDLVLHLDSPFIVPRPCAFYGVFDGHRGSEAATYVRKHAVKLFFEDVEFPQATKVDEVFLMGVESSIRKSFLLADLALSDDCSVVSSSGTTALTVMIFGRALGDWDMKRGTPSPLVSDPETKQVMLAEGDKFLVVGCDGIWDVMSSQDAVSLVRRGLSRHDNQEQCARDLAMEALRLNTIDNLTVIVVSFSPPRLTPLRFTPTMFRPGGDDPTNYLSPPICMCRM